MIIAQDVVKAMDLEYKELSPCADVDPDKLIKKITMFDLYENGPFISEVVIRDESTKEL